jgi:hypothetical protein
MPSKLQLRIRFGFDVSAFVLTAAYCCREQLAAEKLKKKIFDFLAKHSLMTYIDPPPDVSYNPPKE